MGCFFFFFSLSCSTSFSHLLCSVIFIFARPHNFCRNAMNVMPCGLLVCLVKQCLYLIHVVFGVNNFKTMPHLLNPAHTTLVSHDQRRLLIHLVQGEGGHTMDRPAASHLVQYLGLGQGCDCHCVRCAALSVGIGVGLAHHDIRHVGKQKGW